MPITRTIWKNQFTADRIPAWTCPSCHKGILVGDKNCIKPIEDVNSINAHSHDQWEPNWITGSFGGVLKCNNPNCCEKVVFIGKMHVEENRNFDEEMGEWDFTDVENFTAIAFCPPLHLFPVHKDLPKKIAYEIVESFKLYWMDVSSCANKIRIVVELIMDEHKVAKTFINKTKRKGYSLHQRIELFKGKMRDEAELLMAIKWIGNSGSHVNESLTKDDILDAYEILDHVTVKLFEKDSLRLKRLSKTINKSRKPIGRKRIQKK